MNVGNCLFLYKLFPHNFRYFPENKWEYKYDINMYMEMYMGGKQGRQWDIPDTGISDAALPLTAV